MKKDWKRHIAYEVLVILVMLTLLMYLCRLWPIIFLLIIGIFITALRLLFLSPKRVEVVEPLPLPALPEPKEPTEKDVKDLAYSVILSEINRVSNLASTHRSCHKLVHGQKSKDGFSPKAVRQAEKYRKKLLS